MQNGNLQRKNVLRVQGMYSYVLEILNWSIFVQSENRLKHSVLELHPVNYAEYAKKLLNEIKECAPAWKC